MKGKQRKSGLYGVLWLTFVAFAAVLVVLNSGVQGVLVTGQYYENAERGLVEAAEDLQEVLSSASEDDAGAMLYDAASGYGVNFALVAEDGTGLLEPFGEQRSYGELAEALRRESLPVMLKREGQLAYAVEAEYAGRDCYLCVWSQLDAAMPLSGERVVLTVLSALLSFVLALGAGSVVARLIAKPIAEVTDSAKKLAHGDFDFNVKGDYFCREMNELSGALERARSEVSKADRMQKELVANVSHDFKTPLTMIKAYASMIREISGEDKEKRDEHARIIIEESDRLSALVGDLLDLSRLRAGVAGERTVFNLSEDVYSVAERFDYLRETEGYAIETEVEEDVYAFANRERIRQVLYNLIGNAVNYTGEDKRVRVRLFRKGEAARFEVVDTGKGIPAEEAEYIWDRYYRSEATHKRPAGGTGLGLSIVKNILLSQDCPFGVLSEVGKGSCFWVEFAPPPERNERTEGKI